jgi:hypothetical protein
VAADLILTDEVDLILVASTPETTNPVSDQCEIYEVPCISTVAPWQPWFFRKSGRLPVDVSLLLGFGRHHRRVPRPVEFAGDE